MSAALFICDFDDCQPGQLLELTGDEARHAVVVRRIAIGEQVILANGLGKAAYGAVMETEKNRMVVRVAQVLTEPNREFKLVAVQALAKKERAHLAVELLTETGVDEIIAWPAHRSIVQWKQDDISSSLAKWRATARQAAKQSRRFKIPELNYATTKQLFNKMTEADLVLVLHEEATVRLAEVVAQLNISHPEILVIIGPEGGITDQEITQFEAYGGKKVLLTDHVLRTSSAGGVALAQIQAIMMMKENR